MKVCQRVATWPILVEDFVFIVVIVTGKHANILMPIYVRLKTAITIQKQRHIYSTHFSGFAVSGSQMTHC